MKQWKDIMKKENLVVLLLVGLLLLVLAIPTEKKENRDMEGKAEHIQTEKEKDWQEKMESRLEAVLSRAEGVGEVQVFLTCESSGRKVVEKDEAKTVYEKDAKGNEQPYITAEEYPRIAGVLVVAKGGGNPVTVEKIQAAVEVLFQVEPHNLKVMIMN